MRYTFAGQSAQVTSYRMLCINQVIIIIIIILIIIIVIIIMMMMTIMMMMLIIVTKVDFKKMQKLCTMSNKFLSCVIKITFY